MKKNVLLLCPDPLENGGVAKYYFLVKKYFFSNKVNLDFYYTGKVTKGSGVKGRYYKFLSDLLALNKKFPRYDLIVLNPSLDAKAIIRDGLYHFIAKKLFRRNTLVMFHGWNLKSEQVTDRYGKHLFRYLFGSDRLLVLAGRIKESLIRWGVSPDNIGIETTTYEEYVSPSDNNLLNVVFLSRFEKNKGAIEAIKTIALLKAEYPNIKLYMVGEGELSAELLTYVSDHNLTSNVEFTGWLDGERKYELLSKCGIMLFPTSYGEGLPVSVLEGMGAGLAIVTRPAGGLPDIIVEGENGFLVESLEPEEFAEKIKRLFENKDLWERISWNNQKTAKQKFEINNVVRRLEKIYLEVAQ